MFIHICVYIYIYIYIHTCSVYVIQVDLNIEHIKLVRGQTLRVTLGQKVTPVLSRELA